jgi:hypothetical protein
MALAMGTVMSLVMTAANTGLDAGFLERWLRAWVLGTGIAVPTSLVCAPLVRAGVNRVCEAPPPGPRPG